MSRLRVFEDASPLRQRLDTSDGHAIERELGRVGIRFERWTAAQEFAEGVDADAVIHAYRGDVDRLMNENGYLAVDVVQMQPSAPQRDELRAKFLREHTHAEDEVRFFVQGAGMFYLCVEGLVHAVLCEQSDLISVPAGTRHWFDMGPQPSFKAIRLFTNPAGWVAQYTGSAIAERYPKFDEFDAALPTRIRRAFEAP